MTQKIHRDLCGKSKYIQNADLVFYGLDDLNYVVFIRIANAPAWKKKSMTSYEYLSTYSYKDILKEI